MKKKMLEYRKYSGLKILCKKCGFEIHNIKGDGLKTDCKHPLEFQIYKAVLIEPGSGKKKTRNLKSLDYDGAVRELILFKEELANPIPHALLQVKKAEMPMGLVKCITMYIDYLSGVGVLEHEKRERSSMYIDNMTRYCTHFVKFLKSKNINTDTIRIDEITGELVSEYFIYVETKTESSSTFNDRFKPLKGLYHFLKEKRNYNVDNPFKTVQHKAEGGEPMSLTMEEVDKIKNAISPVDSVEVYKSGARKDRYKPWLKDAINLALFTGIRREQIVVLKWSDVMCGANGEPELVKSNNLKVNRLQNRNKTKKDKFVHVPVSQELKALLLNLGFNEKKGTDEYILAPDSKLERKTIIGQMSASFSFFRNKAGVNPELSFSNLRKTYITNMEFVMGHGNVKSITGHSGDAVLKNHYIDMASVARETTRQGFSLYDGAEVVKSNDMQSMPHAVDIGTLCKN